MSTRMARVAAALRRDIAEIIHDEMSDPRVVLTSVTEARVSRDLMHATIAVSCLGDADALREAVECLEAAAGFVRRKLAERMSLRVVPELHFVGDDTAARAARIEHLLREHRDEFGPGEPVDDD